MHHTPVSMAASASSKSKGSAWFWQNLDAPSEQAGARVPYEVLERTTPPNTTEPRVDALTGLELAQSKATGDLSTALEATSKTTPVIPSRPEKGSGNEGKGTPATPEAPVLPAVAAEQAKQAVAKNAESQELISVATASVVAPSEPSAPENWDSILESWHQLLQKWSLDGSLEATAREAFNLDGPNAKPQSQGLLQSYISQWSARNFENLPEIVFLSAEDMRGAMGAYAISTGKIYLNANWAKQATPEQIHAVLTEEQGHHLDAQLNSVDTPGDEGEDFARLLSDKPASDNANFQIKKQDDSAAIYVNKQMIEAEHAITPVIRGNSLYTIVQGPSWTEAEANSVALGGHLTSINNAEENTFLTTKYGSTLLENLWIGLSDATEEGVFQWVDGSTSAYRNWASGEPNDDGNQDYVQFYSFGQWDDTYPNGSIDGVNKGIAELFLSLSVSRTGLAKEGAGVFTTSINLSAGTQSSGNLAEGSIVYWSILGITSDDLASGSDGLTGTGTIINGKLDIQHSLLQDADIGEQFSVDVYTDAERTQQIGISSVDVLEPSPVIRGNSLYTIVQGPSWTEAEANSVALGGHLTSINNAEENTFLTTKYGSTLLENLWIGLSDATEEGVFQWVDGSTSAYRNWASGEPNDDGNQDYVQFYSFGQWDDTYPNGSIDGVNKGIAELFLSLSVSRTGLAKEGAGVFTTSINLSAGTQSSGNLAEGAKVWWQITGISLDDLASGSLTGSGTITNGKLDVQHSLAVDADTGENIEVSVYSDALMTQRIGSTNSAGIQEAPSIQFSNISIIEGINTNTLATLTFTLSSTSTQPINVGYTTVGGTAKAGTDYTATSGTLTIASGQSSGTISIPILNDNVSEANESFTVQLSNPVNATLGATSATITITDTLTSAVTATLPAGVENLTLTGTAAVNGTGNAGPNIITGNTAANTLAGLAGNDTYRFVANTQLGSDTVTEAASAGTDTINLASTTTAVRLNIGITTLQTVNANLKLTITSTNTIENAVGGNSDDVLTGNALANALTGGTGADRLSGLAGNDLLDGGLGNDLLTGGLGLDRFRFASGTAFATTIGNDAIYEFISGEDKIELSKKTFTAITTAAGSPLSSFATVDDDALADSSASVIVYSSSSGGLFYNMNGTTTGDTTKLFEFASLGNVPAAIFASDFTVIA